MKQVTLALLCLTGFTWLCGCRRFSYTISSEPTDVEYQVLSAYASGKLTYYSKQNRFNLVVVKETQGLGEDPQTIAQLYEVLPTLRTVHREVFRSFLETNRHPSNFQSSFALPISYQILTRSEIDYKRRHEWTAVDYDVDPCLALSRVGFNRDQSQAVFYSSWGSGGLWRDGHLVVMEKRADGWKLVREVQLWVS